MSAAPSFLKVYVSSINMADRNQVNRLRRISIELMKKIIIILAYIKKKNTWH